MIKRILVSLSLSLLFSLDAMASNQVGGLKTFSSQTQSTTIKQRKLNTINDYKELVSDLKKAIVIGDMRSKFWLGTLYYSGAKLKDGTVIKPQKEKGLSLLYSAITAGYTQAFSFLSIQYIKQKDVGKLSKIVKLAQESKEISLTDKDYFSSLLASLILDTNSSDGVAIEVALKWLYQAEKKRPTPKMQFIIANMYNMLGNDAAAVMYLNKSCSNKSMETICGRYKRNPLQENKSTCQNF